MALPLLENYERQARERLPAEVAEFVSAGSWDEVSTGEAAAAWHRLRLRPRVLRPVAEVDTAVELLGHRLPAPVAVGPVAFQRLLHPEGEAATAAGVAAAGGLFVAPTRTSVRLERIGATGCRWWLQVYLLRDRALTANLVERAVAGGASALVLTGDTPYAGAKRRSPEPPPLPGPDDLADLAARSRRGDHEASDDRGDWQDPTVTLEAVGWLGRLSGLPVLVKGVLRGDDAQACLAAGAAGVVVSNHGGRQLDRAVATARALAEVVDAVAGRGAVLVDGGLRDGVSVLVALALGADAVLLGRPAMWALAAGGAPAVTALLTELTADLSRAMALAGAAHRGELTADLVVSPPDWPRGDPAAVGRGRSG